MLNRQRRDLELPTRTPAAWEMSARCSCLQLAWAASELIRLSLPVHSQHGCPSERPAGRPAVVLGGLDSGTACDPNRRRLPPLPVLYIVVLRQLLHASLGCCAAHERGGQAAGSPGAAAREWAAPQAALAPASRSARDCADRTNSCMPATPGLGCRAACIGPALATSRKQQGFGRADRLGCAITTTAVTRTAAPQPSCAPPQRSRFRRSAAALLQRYQCTVRSLGYLG